MSAKTWIEVRSDGTGPGTLVFLCLKSDESDEVKRYQIPGVQWVTWACEGPRANAILTIQLAEAHCHSSATIRSDSTTVENMLAELAAGMLRRNDDSSTKWVESDHYQHCSKVISARNGADMVDCDCDSNWGSGSGR